MNRKLILLLTLLLSPCLCAQQQNFPGGGGGFTQVVALPGTCTATSAPVQLTVAPYGIYFPTVVAGSTCIWSLTAPINSIFALDYGVNPNGKYAVDASFTATSGAVVLTANDPIATSADIGTPCFGTTWQGSSLGTYTAFTLIMAQGTIASVTNGQHLACSATSSSTTTGTFAWGGADNSVSLAAAVAAAFNTNPCKQLVLPSGVIWTTVGVGNTATCRTNVPTTSDYSLSVQGQGMRNTIIGLLPNFSFSNTTSCNGTVGGTYRTCFFGAAGIWAHDFSVYGFGYNNTNDAVGQSAIFAANTDSYFWNIDCEQFGASDNNIAAWDLGGAGQLFWNINTNGCGSVGGYVEPTSYQTTYASFFSGNKNYSFQVPATASLLDYGSGFGSAGCNFPTVSVAGVVRFNGTKLFNACTAGNLGTLAVTNGGVAYLNHITTYLTAANQTDLLLSSGATAYSRDSVWTAPGGTGQCIYTPTGSLYYDEGGNSCPGGQINGSQTTGVISPLYVGNQSVNGACTGVATSSQTLGLYGTGANVVATTCTSTLIGTGQVMNRPGTLSQLYVTATAGGFNASSGVVTALKNGSATTVTCTVGTGTGCIDVTHSAGFVQGDLISIQFTTQVTETLAGVKVIVSAQ